MIIIDEAAHISLDLFYETIVPMLELTNTALLAISTPLDEFNYYSKLVEQKDEHGNPFFKTIKAGRVCDDCSRLAYDEMIKCDHIEDTAHWKNPHKLKRLKVLFEGDEARGLRELAGIAASDFTPCFSKEDIGRLFDNPRRIVNCAPDAIYVTVDPNGGGASKMAIASGFYDGLDLVVSVFLSFVVVGETGEKPVDQLVDIVQTWPRYIDVRHIEDLFNLCLDAYNKIIQSLSTGAPVRVKIP